MISTTATKMLNANLYQQFLPILVYAMMVSKEMDSSVLRLEYLALSKITVMSMQLVPMMKQLAVPNVYV